MLQYTMWLLVIMLLPMIGSLVSYFIGKKNETYRDYFNILMTGIEFVIVSFLYVPVSQNTLELFIPDIMGIGLSLKLDVFRYVFVWITVFVWFLTTIYSTQYLIKYKNRNRYYSFFMMTLAFTVGIFLSENIVNLFTFFEMMSFTSYALIIHDEDEYSHEAGKSYIGMAVGGSLVLLMGIFLLFDYTSTLNISDIAIKIRELGSIKYLITGLIIVGFGVKASMFPLHVWLPKAHPAAPTPASAILSGILIKTGIFGILITSGIMMEGDFSLSVVLFIIGILNMLVGGFLAMFQRNIKRILAYSSMSQAGYIILGIGLIGILKEHKAIAVYGVLYHVFNHAIFKVLLFLVAGIIYMILHELSINKIRGFGKHKLVLKVVFIVGLFAITGVPGSNGFISKTLLHEALAEAHHMYHSSWFTLVEILFTLSSSFTVAYLLKIFVAVFIEENSEFKGQYKAFIKKRAIMPMIVLSVVIIYIGIRPHVLLNIIQGAVSVFSVESHIEVKFYTVKNILTSTVTILIGVGIYVGFIRKILLSNVNNERIYINPSLTWVSLEKSVYKPVLSSVFKISTKIFHSIDICAINTVKSISDWVKKLSHTEISLDKNRKVNKLKKGLSTSVSEKKHIKLEGIMQGTRSIAEILSVIRDRLNTMMYSLFVFASVLVIILIILVF
ncbi:complex I subunit 5 family protein [Brassicibacter mesophilus]|uniref:complex I subunit 5 family protein n=1 Tax=Brassicibacter mesophilus TaxID=745119 RepID=UPI003D193BB4